MMILYLKNYEFKTIAHKLGLIYILNIIDLMLGMILFNANFKPATNGFNAILFGNPFCIIFLKILLPIALLGYLLYRIQQIDDRRILRLINLTISLILIFFLITNLVHLSNWINTSLI